MSSPTARFAVARRFVADPAVSLPAGAAGIAFLALFWQPLVTLAEDWWTNPDAGHGLLLGPLAVILAIRAGPAPTGRRQPWLGTGILVAAVALRYLSGLAAELYTMRLSLLGACVGATVHWRGLRQVRHWWLPFVLLGLAIPLPAVVLGTLSLPLQLQASRWGAALLEWRNVPVAVAGNVIHLPGRSLFVTEACSGLRSITALVSLGVLVGALGLRTLGTRLALTLAAIPVAMALNSVRIFLTGFLVFFVDPNLGEGVMHYTEGWAVFVVAFGVLGACAWLARWGERRWLRVPA